MLIKALTQEMTSPDNPLFKWKIGEWYKVERALNICENDLRLYISPAQLFMGDFGPRLFEAEVSGDMREDEDKIVARKVRLIREIPIKEISKWLGLDPHWAYLYCRHVKDRLDIRKHITKPWSAYCYCRNVKDRPSIRKWITNSEYAYLYCWKIKDSPSIRKWITNSEYAYCYCRDVKDRPSVRKYITDRYWLKQYQLYIKNQTKIAA